MEGGEDVMKEQETGQDAATPGTDVVIGEESLCNNGHVPENSCKSGEGSQHPLKSDSTITMEINGVVRSLEELQEDQCTKEDKEEEPEHNDDLPKAPDGGYGWIVCCAVFVNQMIFGGLARSEGLIFLQFQSKFKTSAQLAAWPGSLMSTLNLFMGPVCAAVVNRFSVRSAYMIGSLSLFIGLILTGISPSEYFLFVSHGLLGGFGRGLMSGILILNMYFDKHRSLATGLGMSGVGIGSLWVIPLTQYLFDTLGFTGAFLILAAIVSHGFLLAMLYRPLSMHLRFTKMAERRKKKDDPAHAEEGVAMTTIDNGCHEEPTIHDTPAENGDVGNSTADRPDQSSDNEPPDVESTPSNSQNSSCDVKDKGPTLRKQENKMRTPSERQPDDTELPLTSSRARKRKQDGCLRSSLKILFPVEHSHKKTGKKKKVFDWSLVKDIPFMIFVMANFFFVLAFKTTLTFLPAIAMAKGLTDTEAALMLTITGAMDTFGRVAVGFIMDLRRMRPLRPYVFNLFYFIIAGASLLVPFLDSFAAFAVLSAVYGFTTGASITQKVVVLVDIVGRDHLPSALGIMKWFQGFGTLIGPPLAGALRDALGSYDSSFYLGGASMFGASLLLAFGNVLRRIMKTKTKS